MVDDRAHSQADVEDPILEVLEHGRSMTTQEIYSAVKKRLRLFPGDMERASKRENETKIDQIIANALQDRRRLCRDGLIERTGRGEFQITDGGRAYLRDFRARVQEMSKTLDEMFPDTDWD